MLALLVLLIRNRDRMVTKEEIADDVWQGRTVSDASISSRIRSARRAVDDDGADQAVIRTVHGRGFRFVADVVETRTAQAAEAKKIPEPAGLLTGRPSIAILPFRPLAMAPELAILADAIPYEIIQALSRLRWLAVIARGSTFRFRQPDPDLGLVATALGARRYAERGLDLDPLDPFTNFTMGSSHWLTHDLDAAAEWLDRATTLNPNYAQGFYSSALTSMLIGNASATVAGLDTALHLCPLDPLLYGMHGVRAQMLIQTEHYPAASRWGDRAANTPGAHYLIAMIALAANGLAGRQDQAARWRQEVRRRKADATAAHYFAAFPTRDSASRSRIAAELRRHGF